MLSLAFVFFDGVQTRKMQPSTELNHTTNKHSVSSDSELQYWAAVHHVAIVDSSSVGRIEVAGADRLDLLHRLSTNNLLVGKSGDLIGTVFTTDKGRIFDYVLVLVREESLLLLTSSKNESAFANWVDKYTIMEDIRLNVTTQLTAQITLIGPKAKLLLESLCSVSLEVNRHVAIDFQFCQATVSYRNEFQTETIDLIVDKKSLQELWHLLLSHGPEFGLRTIGDATFRTFKMSRGIPSFGTELSSAHNPLEVGLLHAINFTKGCYIGQEIIARLDTYQKVQNRMVGFTFQASPSELNAGVSVWCNTEELGVITSVSEERVFGQCLAIGMLGKHHVHADNHISVVCDGKTIAGRVHAFPVLLQLLE